MPIYEYDCPACGVTFEKLVRNSANASKVTCPRCNSRKVKKRMSTFAHSVAGGSSASHSEEAVHTPASSASCSGHCGGCTGCGH